MQSFEFLKGQVANLFSDVYARKLKMELASGSHEDSINFGGKAPIEEEDQA